MKILKILWILTKGMFVMIFFLIKMVVSTVLGFLFLPIVVILVILSFLFKLGGDGDIYEKLQSLANRVSDLTLDLFN